MLRRAWHWIREGLDPKAGHQGTQRMAGARGAFGRVALDPSGYFQLGRVYGKDRLAMVGTAPKLYHKSKQHLLLVGGSRAGKGTRILMPNILDHKGVSFIHDPKGENAGIAAEALHRKGHKVCIIDPFDQCSKFLGDDSLDQFKVGYNPLFDINPFDQSSEIMIQSLSHILVKEDKTSNAGPYWTAVNRQVAQGLLAWASVDWNEDQIKLSMSKSPDQFSLYENGLLCQYNNLIQVAHFNELSDERLLRVIKMMVDYRGDNERPNGPANYVGGLIRNGGAIAMKLMNQDGGDADGLRSFLTTFSNEFMWAKSRAMKESLAGYDFQFIMKDLKTEEKMAVFVVVPKAFIPVVRPWLRMLFAQALNACELNPGVPKYPINMIIDEGPQLGHLPEIEQAFAMSAGQGVRVTFVCQDLGQLQEHYGASWETIIGNSAQIILSVGDNTTTNYFSQKAGQTYQKDQKTKKKGQEKVELYTAADIAKQTHPDRDCALYLENGANVQKVLARHYFEDKKRRPGRDYRVHPDWAPKKKRTRPGAQSPALEAPKGMIALNDHREKRRRAPIKATKRIKCMKRAS
jgi:type IV secretion system protein VirD4